MTGKLIVFEGVDFSGKTTLVRKISRWLEKKKIPYLSTFEPGGSDGWRISKILRQQKTLDKTELLLHIAARYEHVEKSIKPALANNKVVISDRYFHSTIAYQCGGNNLNLEDAEKITNYCGTLPTPDICFILTLKYEDFEKRKKEITERPIDLIENRNEYYFKRVISAYEEMKKNKRLLNTIFIDATIQQDKIFSIVTGEIEKLLKDWNKENIF
ncbi:MAG: dTMP kinase [Cyanobacteria bacterium P01_A01_bin.80]